MFDVPDDGRTDVLRSGAAADLPGRRSAMGGLGTSVEDWVWLALDQGG